MMLHRDFKCPQCRAIGTAETKDARRWFYCVSCGLETALINAKSMAKENLKSVESAADVKDNLITNN